MAEPVDRSSAPSLAALALRDRLRPLMRSFRMHRPRSGYCHAGWCQQCRVTLPDGSVVLACMTEAPEGAASRLRLGARLAGKLAERLPPWFYERRLLRPRFLRQFYLDRLRRLSGAPHLSAVQTNASAASHTAVRTECLVVGGGLSGLAAAAALAAAGRDVVLIDAEQLGGRARWREELRAKIAPAVQRARDAGVQCLESVLCVGLYEGPWRALCVSSGNTILIHYHDLIVATGAYDRLPAFAGNDLPGVIGVRAFERLSVQRMIPDGAAIGLWGSRDEVVAALATARSAGISAIWTAAPGDMRNRHHFEGARVERAHGRASLQAIDIAGHGRVRCDILVTAFSQPTYELQTQMGHVPRLCGDPPVLCFDEVAIPHLLMVGEAAGTSDLQGLEEAATSAARDWIRDPSAVSCRERATPCAPDSPGDDALVCLCEDVRAMDIRKAVADGYGDIELIKRHTGAGTGPCQGKLCHAELLRCAEQAGVDVHLPTARPLVSPVRLDCFLEKR